uniref:Uncharacterized protein n=1 Tax=Lepeophtheirus salmonis TaxID=72036 RepID=A0A0K2UU76_LEPSM
MQISQSYHRNLYLIYSQTMTVILFLHHF